MGKHHMEVVAPEWDKNNYAVACTGRHFVRLDGLLVEPLGPVDRTACEGRHSKTVTQ